MPHFHHFSICNQNQSVSNLVSFQQNIKAIALLLGQTCLIFITFQSAIEINQCQIWSFFSKIPRLQPYFLAKNASFSSLFNLQSNSISVKFGHFSAKYHGYTLTVWPKMPHFHHFSICNQNQSVSNLVIFQQNTKAIALLFGQKCLIFIIFQSAIKINQCQIWSFFSKIPRLQPYFLAKNALFSSLFNLQSKSISVKFGHFSANYQGYSLTLWPKMPHFHHFSICNQNQSVSTLVIFQQIPRLYPYFLAKNASFSSLFNLQSKSISVKFGHFSLKYQGYSLTFWPKMPHFHHFSICNQNQSVSNLVIFQQTTKAIALHCGQKCLIFITFQSAIKINQCQLWSFFSKYQGYSLTFWAKMPHFHHFSICNQTQSVSNLVIFQQKIKAIALLFGQKCLIFITFQSAIKINQCQIWSVFSKIPRLQPYFSAKHASFSSLFNLQSNSISVKFGHFSAKYQGYSLTVWVKMPHFHHFSICNQNQSVSNLVIFQQNTKAIALLFGQKCLIFIIFQSAIKINQCQIWSFFSKIPRLQPYFLAKNALFSSLLNLLSKSISVKFGHFSAKYHGYTLTFWAKLPHFHHFSICNQTQSVSNLVSFQQNTRAIALLFGQKCLIFIIFQSAIKINECQIWSVFSKMPRLQPYFLGKNASFSSLFNLHSKSISVKFGHFSAKYQGYSLTFRPKMPHFHHFSICNQNQSVSNLVIFQQNTTAIPLLFGQICLIFITFQSAIKINQCQIWSFFSKIPRLQPYFLAKNASFSSLFNLQSNSISVKFGHFSAKYHGYTLTVWPKMPHFHHFSICNQNQSVSNLVIFQQNTKAIALLFGQKCLIFIIFQSAIKINQCQIWSFFSKIPRLQPYFLAKNALFSSLFNLQSKSISVKFGHFSANYQGYSLTLWPKMPHFHHFSICNQNQSVSTLVIFQEIPRLYPYFLAKNASFSSLFNLQSKSISVKFGYLSLKYQGYSLTFWAKMPHFHHFSICNQNQSVSNLVIFQQTTKAIALHCGQKCLIFITFQSAIKINQCQLWSFFSKYQGYSLTFWAKMPHFHHFSICNQTQSVSNLVIFQQKIKSIALLFGQKCLIFITFQSAIKINQCQIWSVFSKIPRLQPYFSAKHASFSSLFNLQSNSISVKFGHFSAKYQGYSLTVWVKMPHFHHFSICNQNQSVSNLVIFQQNTKAIALLFGQKCLIFIIFQSAIKINQCQIWSFFSKIPRLQPYFLAKNALFSSLLNLLSKSISVKFGHFSAKYHGYTLTFWAKLPHFHHFSICNQTQSVSNLVSFQQNTRAIALLFGQKCLIFITFQSAIKINEFQIWSVFIKMPRLQPYFLGKNASFSSLFNLHSKSISVKFGHFSAKYQGYSLTFRPKMPHFHHFSICNQNQSVSNLVIFQQNTTAIPLLFGQICLIFITFQSAIKSISVKFGHFSAKYQGYSLTFWPKMPHFHHFSICNQNQSVSNLVIFQQNTKAIALLFGQKCLIFITFQSAIKLNQCQIWSLFSKIPRLQPYFVGKNASFSSLFNLQSNSISVKFGHFSAKYQGYSLTFWAKMPHFHHLSICNQTQSVSNLVIFQQNTKAIALLFRQKCLIFITFQSAIKINQC